MSGKHWAVMVYRNGENLLTIESNSLAGKPEFNDDEAQCIRDCGRHLLAFIGGDECVPAGPPPAQEQSLVGADGSFDIRTLAAEHGWLYTGHVVDWLRVRLEELRRYRQQPSAEAARTLASITAMLGWMNVPPRHIFEAEIRAMKARIQTIPAMQEQHTADLAQARAEIDRLTALLEAWRPFIAKDVLATSSSATEPGACGCADVCICRHVKSRHPEGHCTVCQCTRFGPQPPTSKGENV
jgi:hypothetical protein